MRTRNVLKRFALSALKHSGVFGRVKCSKWRSQRLLILGYHGISIEDEHHWDSSLYMSASSFEQRLELIRKHKCLVLPLSEAIYRLYLNDLPPASVALTFDDGAYDFYTRAYPLLRQYGFPSTVYLTTYYAQTGEPVFDTACSYMLWKSRGRVVNTDHLIDGCRTLDLRTNTSREAAENIVLRFAKKSRFSPDEESGFVASLADRLGFDYCTFRKKRIVHLLNAREVSELSNAGVEFQLHTHRHRAPLDRALFIREIEDNRKAIAGMCGISSSHFCYPSNFHKNEFLPWLTETKVFSATTCELGLASPQSNCLLLPRVIDSANICRMEFESWLTGVSAFLPHRAAPMKSGVAEDLIAEYTEKLLPAPRFARSRDARNVMVQTNRAE